MSFLSLADPFRNCSIRVMRAARAALGGVSAADLLQREACRCWRDQLAIACAIGFAVSIALYLPTLFAGAGRIATPDHRGGDAVERRRQGG